MFKKLINLFRKNSKVEQKSSPSENRYKTGFVRFINHSKRYGFIKSNQTNNDVYVHFADTIDKIYPGDKVKFKVEKNEKGLRAREVVVI